MPPKPFEIYRRLLREGWQDVGGGKGSHRKLKRGDRTIMLPLRRKSCRRDYGRASANRSVALRCEKARERTNHALHVSCDFHGERVGRL